MRKPFNLYFIAFFSLCGASKSLAQGVVFTPLAGRYIKPQLDGTLASAIITDTLTLPFFDDFTSTLGYPSAKRWTDNQVWVNNNFSLDPPNYNVATFDHLNKKGKPYSVLNKNNMAYADSLTSQPINLFSYKSGINQIQYLPSDEIILSFYLELKGLGDVPESEDSLILFFRTKTNKWVRVWSKAGSAPGPFKLYSVPIDSAKFLYNDFQFRFVNFTKTTGNLNHWHIDYVRMEKYKNRSGGNDIFNIQDVGIVRPSYTPFKNYFSLPYSHYKTDILGQKLSEHQIKIRNLNASQKVQTRFAYDVQNQYGTIVYSVPFSSSSRNILENSDSIEKFQTFVMDTFSGRNPAFQVTYKIDPQSNDGAADAYNTDNDNNKITVKHQYTPWYAYDDGSAEGGFGLDYAFLGNIKGQFAMKFNNLKSDSLRGISMYFNRSESDVSFKTFTLRIWKTLSPIGSPDNQDQLLYEFEVANPVYTDSFNKFVYIFFDTVLPLPKGDYYIGWKQSQPYILNVGYDNNYRYNREEVGNPNLFHNLLGSWERADYDVKGVPMMRPLFGLETDYIFNTKHAVTPSIKVFPNPCADYIYWDSKFTTQFALVFGADGKAVIQKSNPGNTLNIEKLKSGLYTLQLLLNNGQIVSKQIVKQ